MKAKKYANGGKPPIDPKKPLKLDASAKEAIQNRPVDKATRPHYEADLRRRLALRDADMKRPIQPSYPELLFISAANAIKSATIPATMKTAKQFLPKKAAALFAADLAVEGALDKESENRKK